MRANEKAEQCDPCATGSSVSAMSGFGFRLGLSLVFAGQGMVFSLGYNNASQAGEAPAYGSLPYILLHGALFLSAIFVGLLLGGPLLRELASAVRERRLSVEALFLLSGLGALVGSVVSSLRGVGSLYYEVVAIVLCVYAIGKQVGAVQRGKVGAAVAGFKETFNTAKVIAEDGHACRRRVEALQQTDRVQIGPGEPVPVDGHVLEGCGYVRETALSGEPVPVSMASGDRIRAGTWSVDGHFVVTPDLGRPRELESILRLLAAEPDRPSRLQESADRLMTWFVPVVCLVSVATFGWWWWAGYFWEGILNAMAVLLVACPCALGLAMPSGLWAGLYYLSQKGLVGRHGRLLDILAHADTLVFDKTGTLTEFKEAVDCEHLQAGTEEARVLGGIRSLACATQHPVSRALAQLPGELSAVTDFKNHPGEGMQGCVGGQRFVVGEASLLRTLGVSCPESTGVPGGKPVYVAMGSAYMGFLVLRERLREETAAALEALKRIGCECHILSGDPNPAQLEIGGVVVCGGLSAHEKARHLERLAADGHSIVFVGDGINDLEAMQVAEAGLAIDAGVALATESADGVLLGGHIGILPTAILKARKIRRQLLSNLKFALFYNGVGMALAAGGMLHPVVAALLMVGSSVVVSYRALRAASA